VFVASFFVAATKDSTAAYSLSVVSFVCVVSLYAAGVLGYKVGGSHLSLEAKVNTLEKENTELKESVTALAKSIYMVSSENAPAYGFDHAYSGLLDKYLTPVNHLIEGDIKATVEEDLKKLAYPKNP
jgi:ribosomal protein S13